MLVETLKWRNSKVLAIFTGKQYIFTNEFYGILAVATRKGFGKDEQNSFTLEYGNKHTLGCSLVDSVICSLAKSFIKKFENKYVSRDITFDVVNVDVNDKYYIECGTKER